MKLRRLVVRRMPGIEAPFTLDENALGPGLNVVVGPNGSGKTSLCRAVRGLLWPHIATGEMSVEARWTDGQSALTAVREGRGAPRWQRDGEDAPAPELPDGHLARCYFLGLRDLLSDEDAADKDLAREIRRRMAGGFDLDGALADFADRPQVGRSEQKALKEARSAVERLKTRHGELADSEASLRLREEQLAADRRKAEATELVVRALSAAALRGDLDAAREELSAFPRELADLRDDDATQLDAAESDVAEARKELDRAAADAERARDAIAANTLPAGPVESGELKQWDERLRSLQNLQGELERLQTDEARTQGALERARQDLTGEIDGDDEPRVDPEALRRMEEVLREIETRRTAQDSISQFGVQLEVGPLRTGREDVESAVRALEDWLAVGTPDTRPWLLAVAAGGLVIAVGLAAGGLAGRWDVGGGAIVLGAVLMAYASTRNRAGNDPRAGCRESFDATGEPPPPEWTSAGVRRRLRELRVELADFELYALKMAEVGRLLKVKDRLGKEREDLSSQLREVRAELGVDPDLQGVSLLALAHAAHDYLVARVKARGAAEAAADVRRRRDEALAALNEFLGRNGGEPAGDPSEAAKGLRDLEKRSEALSRAQEETERAERAIGDLGGRVEDLENRVAAFYRRAGVETGDRAAFDARLQMLGGHHIARDRVAALEAEVASESRGVPEDLLTADPESLRQRRLEGQAAQSSLDARVEEIASIKADVEAARRGASMEEALGRETAARECLTERRQEMLAAAAGRFLLHRVRERHEHTAQPEVLRRARRLFSLFTHHAYELRVDPDARFRAWDVAAERGLALGELSDGTRCQLLLATRLAFAFAAERGVRLPLFLDEALSVTDPERFAAVVESLCGLVEDEERQVVYLTSNPADVRAVDRVLQAQGRAAVEPVDLGRIRRISQAGAPSELELPPIPQPVSPEGLSPEEFGARIGVPALDPWAPVASMHLYRLLHDDLPLLARLVGRHVETVGQWRNLVRSGVAGATVERQEAARVTALADAADAFVRHWRVGRNRPVPLEALVASGAVSDTFLPAVAALLSEVAGDGQALLDGLGSGRVDRFRTQKRDQLGTYLSEQGHLDLRPTLDHGAVSAHVLAEVASHVDSGRVPRRDLEVLVERLWVWTA